ncbi:MAG: Hpt domain-containing protein [Porphyrobacter sp.]|nr:Hpt domain-containing protein [Porphyrobacter sp.]
MAYASGDFDSNLAAAAGDDLALREELRAAFLESLSQQIDLLGRSRCDGNWEVAAMRIIGLGTSFHAQELVDLASEALDGAPSDPAAVRKLSALYNRFADERPS